MASRRWLGAACFAASLSLVTVATAAAAEPTETATATGAASDTELTTQTTVVTTTETVTTETITTTVESLSLPPLQGPQYRYPNTTLFPRIFIDIVAVPASVVGWDDADWAGFSAVAVPVVALMLPFNPSMDASFQDWVRRNQTQFLDDYLVKVKTPAMSIFTIGYMGVLWGAGWVSQSDTALEFASITSEALVVGQFYHLSLKVLIGREGPYQGTRNGIVHGPTVEWFPGGTPSGHLVTTSVLASVWGEYFDSWILRGAGLAITGYMAAASVYGNAHFLSEVIWGAGMGYAVTSWVVRNRSSRYRYTADGGRTYVGLAPLSLPDGGGGVQVVGSW